ncbi:MAG: helix-turn-helix transcriptional regulator [Dehalococcoidia bacterium]|nr:helix-turn-helix transcriptional regulator [Dehalococcoidia bacterium]
MRAAASAFAGRGYDGASVDAIAASVGLSKGAVYAHFPSKLELYLGVLASLLEQAEWRLERVAGAVRDGSSPMEAARHYLGLAGDAQHAALMSELWRTAAIEAHIRGIVERFVEERLGSLSRAAVERGLPCGGFGFAQSVARFIDAELLYRRVDDAAGQVAGS